MNKLEMDIVETVFISLKQRNFLFVGKEGKSNKISFWDFRLDEYENFTILSPPKFEHEMFNFDK